MLALPFIVIVNAYFPIALPSMITPGVPDGDGEYMFSPVGANMASVPEGLFLIVIGNFPGNVVLYQHSK